MAQYYHITDMGQFDIFYIATLSQGLPLDSRSKRMITGEKYTSVESLLMLACDLLNLSVWLNSADGAKGRNRPKSLFEKQEKEAEIFENGEQFQKAWEVLNE